MLSFTDATYGTQYKETLPAALPESTQERQTDFSDLALVCGSVLGVLGCFVCVVLSNILYRLPTVDMGDKSLLAFFKCTVQLSLNCMKTF